LFVYRGSIGMPREITGSSPVMTNISRPVMTRPSPDDVEAGDDDDIKVGGDRANPWRDDAGWHIVCCGLNLMQVQSSLAGKVKGLPRLDLGREG
jgi:hypothetical protein